MIAVIGSFNVLARKFSLHKEKTRKFYSNIYPTRCNVTQFILSGNCSTCFGWYHHPSSGAQTTVSTASGICHIVIAICRYRGRVGTGSSVLWVAYLMQLCRQSRSWANGTGPYRVWM